jgi:hypothetical protein
MINSKLTAQILTYDFLNSDARWRCRSLPLFRRNLVPPSSGYILKRFSEGGTLYRKGVGTGPTDKDR